MPRTSARATFLVTLATMATAQLSHAQCSGWITAGYGFPGFTGRVTVLSWWDPDGPGPQPQTIVAGGSMTASGATTLSNIAKWDHAAASGAGAWQDIAGGTDGEITCLAPMPAGDLIAGGIFSNAGAPRVSTLRIARYNGTAWVGMAGGMNSAVHTLTVRPASPTPELYAGGWFTQAGTAVTRVARWTGTTWASTTTGTGFNDWTWALTVLPAGNTLVCGGAFSTYNGGTLRRAATYNGTTWSALGGGVTTGGEIYELFVTPNGDLIASGNFTQIGGVNARNVARWNGTSWSAMGAGFPLPARDFAVVGGVLYAANVLAEDFTGAAVAHWDGTSWTRIAFTNGTIFALLALGNGDLLVAGDFTTVGGAPASRIAIWRPPLTADFNGDGDFGTDADIEAFFACLGGACCPLCGDSDFNNDGDFGTDQDIESFFRVLAGGTC
jgi:hypothetical protein